MQDAPILYWVDMPIEFQYKCEQMFHAANSIGQLVYHQDQCQIADAVHIIDLQSMTILNTLNGDLNRIKRVVSDVPHWRR